jgi:hypothetical protein
LAQLLEQVDVDGWRHPFVGTNSIEEWSAEVDGLLSRYRRATDSRIAAKLLGESCRRDPRLFGSQLVRDQILVWLLEVADGVVWRDPRKKVPKHYRSEGAAVAERALRSFAQALWSAPRGNHVAAETFVEVYKDVERRVQEARLDRGHDAEEALRRRKLAIDSENQRALGASHGRRLEITVREVARTLGLGVTRTRELRDAFIPDAEGSATEQFTKSMMRAASRRRSHRRRSGVT